MNWSEINRVFVRTLLFAIIILLLIFTWVSYVSYTTMGMYFLIVVMAIGVYAAVPCLFLSISISLIVSSFAAFSRRTQGFGVFLFIVPALCAAIVLSIPAYMVATMFFGPLGPAISDFYSDISVGNNVAYLERANDFKDGVARVSEGGPWYFINKSGIIVTPSNPSQSSASRKKLEMEGKIKTGFDEMELEKGFVKKYPSDKSAQGNFGVFNENTGQYLATFDRVDAFHANLAIAYLKGNPGVIDKAGRWIVAPGKYRDIYPFQYGMARVRLGDDFGFIDTSGALVIPARYSTVRDFNEDGTAPAWERDGTHKWGLISRKGEWALSPMYEYISEYGEGWYAVETVGRYVYGYIDTAGKETLPPQYHDAEPFHEGLAAVSDERDRWGYIDKQGRMRIPCQFEQANDFHEGLAAVEIGDKQSKLYKFLVSIFIPGRPGPKRWGYIDKTGKFVITKILKKK